MTLLYPATSLHRECRTDVSHSPRRSERRDVTQDVHPLNLSNDSGDRTSRCRERLSGSKVCSDDTLCCMSKSGLQPTLPKIATVNQFAIAIAAAVGMTMLYWWPMWLGDGFIGGDIMDYFFPQKVYLSHALAEGDLPLWNNLVNLGYPFVADSQIAMWYPTTIPLYSLFSVEAAFQINILLHYVLAFLLTWAYARSIGIRQLGAMVAALAFTYGWFPPRLSVEWSITTGCYLPGILLCVERFLRTSRVCWLGCLAILGGLQLLAGHFSLAFITHLITAVYVVLRCMAFSRSADKAQGWRPILWIFAMQFAAFPLAGAQLVPTWELRQESSRGGLPIPEVEDGRIPWFHLRQLVMPWIAYRNDMSEYPPPYTNGPAASLFVGVIPFFLAMYAAVVLRKRNAAARIWRIVIPIAIVFAVGWLTNIYKYLPGFGYFKIPGRYSILAALGLAVLAGVGADRLATLVRYRRMTLGSVRVTRLAGSAALICCVVTFVDLYVYGRTVAFTSFVPLTIDEILAESQLRKMAESSPEPLRMLIAGNNALTATGISAVPGFQGLIPGRYIDHADRVPPAADPAGPLDGQLDLIERYGVTHIVFLEPYDRAEWGLSPAGEFTDAFLSRVMNRFDSSFGPQGGVRPFSMAQVSESRGRAALVSAEGELLQGGRARITAYEPDFVTVEVSSSTEARLVLTDLVYPGWRVTVDGVPAEQISTEGLFRSVDVAAGDHEIVWVYQPASVRNGLLLSLLSVAAIALMLVIGRLKKPAEQ